MVGEAPGDGTAGHGGQEQTADDVLSLALAVAEHGTEAGASKVKSFDDQMNELIIKDRGRDVALKAWWAPVLLCAMLLQVILSDVIFIYYAKYGMHWVVPWQAINGWLAATVVELVGVVLVITKYLFPEPPQPKKRKKK